MLNSQLIHPPRNFLVSDGLYDVQHLELTYEKIAWIWEKVCSFRTLHSDYGDKSGDAFVTRITSAQSLWFQVMRGDEMVGIVFIDMSSGYTDCEGHFFFFDKEPAKKTAVVRKLAQWIFDEFSSLARITVNVPSIYFSTKRLVLRIGFKEEGVKRNGIQIGGRLHDITSYGLLREEVNG